MAFQINGSHWGYFIPKSVEILDPYKRQISHNRGVILPESLGLKLTHHCGRFQKKHGVSPWVDETICSKMATSHPSFSHFGTSSNSWNFIIFQHLQVGVPHMVPLQLQGVSSPSLRVFHWHPDLKVLSDRPIGSRPKTCTWIKCIGIIWWCITPKCTLSVTEPRWNQWSWHIPPSNACNTNVRF